MVFTIFSLVSLNHYQQQPNCEVGPVVLSKQMSLFSAHFQTITYDNHIAAFS